jgi:hypothetical protein
LVAIAFHGKLAGRRRPRGALPRKFGCCHRPRRALPPGHLLPSWSPPSPAPKMFPTRAPGVRRTGSERCGRRWRSRWPAPPATASARTTPEEGHAHPPSPPLEAQGQGAPPPSLFPLSRPLPDRHSPMLPFYHSAPCCVQVIWRYALWISGFLLDMCGAALMLTALSQAPLGLPHHPPAMPSLPRLARYVHTFPAQ